MRRMKKLSACLSKRWLLIQVYALPKALAAWCHGQRVPFLWTNHPEQEHSAALRLAKEAARLDSDDPLVLTILASADAVGREFTEAVPLIDRAVQLDPNSAWAWHHSGWIRNFLNRPDLAIEHFQRSIRISPLDPYNFDAAIGIGIAHFHAERFAEAASSVRRGLQRGRVRRGHGGLLRQHTPIWEDWMRRERRLPALFRRIEG